MMQPATRLITWHYGTYFWTWSWGDGTCDCLLGTASDGNSKWALFSPRTEANSKSNTPHRQGYTLPTRKLTSLATIWKYHKINTYTMYLKTITYLCNIKIQITFYWLQDLLQSPESSSQVLQAHKRYHSLHPITVVNTQNVSVTKIVDSSSIQHAETKYGLRIQFLALVFKIIHEVWLNA